MVATFLFDLGLEDVYLTSVHKYGDNTLFYAATGIRREWKIRFEQVSKFVCIETDQLEAKFPEIKAHTITGGALAWGYGEVLKDIRLGYKFYYQNGDCLS